MTKPNLFDSVFSLARTLASGVSMDIKYQSQNYDQERVTGRYVRVEGRKGNYRFRVFETITCGRTGKLGHGPTIREYVFDGSDMPDNIRDKCIKDKHTEEWPL